MIRLLIAILCPQAQAAPRVELTVLAGARTAPEASVERPDEWDLEVDPSVLAALLGEAAIDTDPGLSLGLRGAAWGYLPEEDADRLQLEPWAGWLFTDDSGVEVDVAARYAWFAVPMLASSSSRRGEALLRTGLRRDGWLVQARAVGIDRTYPRQPGWSFRSVEAGADAVVDLGDSGLRAELGAAGQGNWGRSLEPAGDTTAVPGSQLRLAAGLGHATRSVDLRLRYRLYLARAGEAEDTVRPQFTPVGEISDDADALSAGGFTQHRVEGSLAWERGDWGAAASALLRLRDNTDPNADASFARTIHGQLTGERELGDRWALSATVGSSAARLEDGREYVDVYAWLGLSWRWAGATGQPDGPPPEN